MACVPTLTKKQQHLYKRAGNLPLLIVSNTISRHNEVNLSISNVCEGRGGL
jgi:hypothetical protein